LPKIFEKPRPIWRGFLLGQLFKQICIFSRAAAGRGSFEIDIVREDTPFFGYLSEMLDLAAKCLNSQNLPAIRHILQLK